MTVRLVRLVHGATQRVLVLQRPPVHDATSADQPRQGPHGEGAPAESEEEDPVAGVVHAHQRGVEILHVARQPPPKRAPHDLEQLEALGANPIVVERHLRGAPSLVPVPVGIHGLVELEDVGATTLDGTIPGPVGAQDDVARRVVGHAGNGSVPAYGRLEGGRRAQGEGDVTPPLRPCAS